MESSSKILKEGMKIDFEYQNEIKVNISLKSWQRMKWNRTKEMVSRTYSFKLFSMSNHSWLDLRNLASSLEEHVLHERRPVHSIITSSWNLSLDHCFQEPLIIFILQFFVFTFDFPRGLTLGIDTIYNYDRQFSENVRAFFCKKIGWWTISGEFFQSDSHLRRNRY